jgi:DNA polymerase III delta subunit
MGGILMDFKALKTELDNGERQNFYVLAGEEKAVMRKYIKRIDPDAKEVDSFKDLIKKFQNVGLFNNGEHGTFYIYNDKTVMDMEIKDILRLIGTNRVILIYDSIDGRSKFFKSASIFTFEFPKFDSDTLAKHVQSLLGSRVDTNIAIELSQLCNNEVARVELECDKLSRLDKPITMDLIHELVQKKAEDVIFDMIKAVEGRKIPQVYNLLQELKERRESPVKIVSLLYTSFRNILLIQSYSQLSNQEIADKTGLTSGQVYYNRSLINCFALEDLRDNLIRIQQAEVNIKTGKMDQDLALESLLLNILR